MRQPEIHLNELFMAKVGCDWKRCYHGTIVRSNDANSNPFVFGKIKVNNGYVIARANDQWELGEKLDELVIMILDHDLHKNKSVLFKRYGFEYNMN